jgi:CDP-4-dehydro-6-deoxyglucose reductase
MSYRVQVPETGESFVVPAGETILSAALSANVALPHDCQLGGCGTCRVKLLDGVVTYSEPPFALTPEEQGAGYALACQAQPMSDLLIQPSRAAELVPDPERHIAIIRSLRAVSPLVTHLVLEVPAAAPNYRPGQYLNVVMEDGSTRSFSMASAPREGLVDFHIRRLEGGRFTGRTLAQLGPGDTLEVEYPHGSFFLHPEDDRPLLMVATGTGLAPIKAMLESLMDNPECPPVSLYWGTRTADDLYLHDDIQHWDRRLCDFRYVPVLSRADDAWLGRRGHVHRHVASDFADLSEHAIYLCGSPAMIADAKSAFIARGASVDHIHAEGFTQQAQAAAECFSSAPA